MGKQACVISPNNEKNAAKILGKTKEKEIA